MNNSSSHTSTTQLFSVPDLLSLVLVQLSSRSEWDVRKEATWVISNAITAGQKRHVAHLVELGVVGPLCELLDVGEGRVLLIAMVSEAAYALLAPQIVTA